VRLHVRIATPVLVALAIVLTGADALRADHTKGVTNDSIKIGFFGPMTGPYYLYGKLVMNGADIVYNEVNRQGGVHGRKIVTVREDDKCDTAAGIAAMKKLIHQHEVFLVHGGGCSNPAMAARAEAEQARTPFVNFLAVADKITLPRAPYIWTTALTARMESLLQVDFALSRPNTKRIAIVSQHDAWGQSRYEPLVDYLKKKGVAAVADEEMTVDANDATPQVLRLIQAKPDVVIAEVYPKPGAVLLRDMYKLGLRVPVIAQRAISDLVELEKLVGIPGATDQFYTISEVRYTPEDSRVSRWAELLNRDFPGDRISIYTLSGIASAQVVVDVLKRAGKDLTAEGFKAAMDTLCGSVTELYAGDICFTADDPQGNKNGSWIRLEKSKVVTVGARWPAK
jgi:branched-chain amino acid transport system substrate-binding protein